MKALTIWQPWASLIAIGAKPFEFRSWPAPSWATGQRIGIHAGARPLKRKEVEDLLTRLQLPDEAWTTCLKPELAIPLLELALKSPTAVPLSSMMCTAVLGKPINGWKAAEQFGGKINDSDRDEHANWAWPLTDVEPLQPPVFVKGAQGFWNWDGSR